MTSLLWDLAGVCDLEDFDEHCVPHVDRCGDTVHSVNGRFSSAGLVFIFDVVMKEGHVVKKLNRRSGCNSFLLPASDTLASEKSKRGPEPFPTAIEKFPNFQVELLGFAGSRQVAF